MSALLKFQKKSNNVKEFLINLVISLWAVLAPIHAVMAVVFVLVAADMVTGIIAARKRGESLTSAGMRRTISKLVVYQIAMISGFLVEKYTLISVVPIAKIIAGLISATELKSVLENVSSSANVDVFKDLISKLDSVNAQSEEDRKARKEREAKQDEKQDTRDAITDEHYAIVDEQYAADVEREDSRSAYQIKRDAFLEQQKEHLIKQNEWYDKQNAWFDSQGIKIKLKKTPKSSKKIVKKPKKR